MIVGSISAVVAVGGAVGVVVVVFGVGTFCCWWC